MNNLHLKKIFSSTKKGVGRIYKALNLPCIPVALNTGKVWPKNSFLKYPGDIHISFLEPIMPGKEKNQFAEELENKIYSEIERFDEIKGDPFSLKKVNKIFLNLLK